jgi:hypothetical protein
MTERCENCKFHFKTIEHLGDGSTLPAEICAVGKIPDDDCKDFDRKWRKSINWKLKKHLKGSLSDQSDT